jgi:hypothetical protein
MATSGLLRGEQRKLPTLSLRRNSGPLLYDGVNPKRTFESEPSPGGSTGTRTGLHGAFVETSAGTGQGLDALTQAIQAALDWEQVPGVTSSLV